MTRVPAPASLTQTISQLATQYAREDVQGRGWHSSGALQQYSAEGEAGIRSTVRYILIQNKGFRPFVMLWVNNHSGAIPLGCKQGDGPHFRRGGTAGTPGMVNIPHRGKVWRDRRWSHPGLPRKAFIEKSLQRAIKESRKDIQQALIDVISGRGGG